MERNKLIGIFQKHNPQTEMSKDEMMFFMKAMMSTDPNFSCDLNEIDKKIEMYEHFKPLLESFVGQVFLKRIETMTTLKMSFGAFVILIHHMPSPGAAVMYCYHLHNKVPENTVVTLETIGEVFPWGFFSEQQLKEIWAAQKVSTEDSKGYTLVGSPDNMIDYLEMWKELTPA